MVSFEEGGVSSPVVGYTLYASWDSTFSDMVTIVAEWDVSVGHCKGCKNSHWRQALEWVFLCPALFLGAQFHK